jgi:hypothetical protein
MSALVAASLFAGLLAAGPGAAPSAAADVMCDVQFNETTSSQGFVHPGVGLTASTLQNVRQQVAAGAEPWKSYYDAMTSSSAASLSIKSANESATDPSKPAGTAFNSQSFNGRFIKDGLAAYTQATLYSITGNETYRANAMHIIRIWSQMDPAQYAYFADAHIHTGIPLNRMVSAAEILRYSSCTNEAVPWTDADTQAFTTNLITPVIETFQHDQNHFMNQHSYPLMGAMAGYIFTDNRARYDEAVEWFTVNSTATDQGFNGSVSRLFRLITKNDATGQTLEQPVVQHIEMGRDQAHGGGDITNAAIISRMLLAQNTKVDPVAGTVSSAANAVGPYEFLNDRILAAADYFWRFMQGYDTPWVPAAYAISPDGTIRDTYNHISNSYRGRYNTASFWDLYYYYTYVRGIDLSQKAPYFNEAFSKRMPSNFYYGGSLNRAWDNVDGGGDFWLYAPASASGSSLPVPQKSPTNLDIEDRYTALSGTATKGTDGTTGYVSLQASTAGTKIAFLTGSTSKKTVGLRIRTNGTALMRLTFALDRTIVLPDTGGAWTNVTLDLVNDEGIADLLNIEVTGDGTTVDVDSLNINAGAELSAPQFTAVNDGQRIVGYSGAALDVDLSAKDPVATDTLTYSAAGLPPGAELNPATGHLTWTPASASSPTVTVWVSDGTTTTARRITLDIAADRSGALAKAQQGFDSQAIYVSATLDGFNTAKAAAAAAASGDDAGYLKQLQSLVAATSGLALVSPRSPIDQSLNYPGILAASTAGTNAFKLVDGDNQTGTSYPQAQNLSHTFDFGPDFRVSANSFGFASNIFADRLANSAVFGSNDAQNWTRLTPGVTAFTQDYQTLDVDPSLRSSQFRYIRVQLLQPQPDVLYGIVRNLFEMNEFHILGDRHEIGNQLKTVSIGSPQAIAAKIQLGDTAKLTMVAKKPLASVSATIQGKSVAATSSDGINWSAEAVMSGVPTGQVGISVGFTNTDGSAGPTSYSTTDGSTLMLAGSAERAINVPKLATVTASDKQWPGTGLSADQVGNLLFDGNGDTFGDLNTSTGSWYKIDFGPTATVRLDEILLLPRATAATRANGTVVQGSADGTNWVDLISPVSGATANKWIDVKTTSAAAAQHYRYVRLYNATAWSGNLSEVQFYGDVAYPDSYLDTKVADTSTSTQGSTYLYNQEINRIHGALTAPNADRTLLLNQFLAASALLKPLSDLYPQITIPRTAVTASSVAFGNTATAEDNGWRAFDGDPATSPDTTSATGWVQVDLGPEASAVLGAVKYLPRAGNVARANGAQIQGSNDGTNFTTLATISNATAAQWYTLPVQTTTAYRYLRYYTASGYANIAELKFHAKAVDKTLLELMIGRAMALDGGAWTGTSYAALQQALDDGQSVNADTSATQAAVDSAAQAIDSAIAALVPRSTGKPRH